MTRLEDGTVEILRDELNRARKDILKIITDSPKPYELRRLKGVLEGVDNELRDLEQRLLKKVPPRVGAAAELGLGKAKETGAGWGVEMKIVDVGRDQIAAMQSLTQDYLKGITADAAARIHREINAMGILGQSLEDTIDHIGRNLEDPSTFRSIADRAEAIARTEMTTAFSLADEAMVDKAEQLGLKVEMNLMLGPRACEKCIELEAQGPWDSKDPDRPRLPIHPQCLADEETSVFAPDKIAALIATYRGTIFEIIFASGTRLSITPNHLFLTRNGFASAQSLREGDNVFYCPILQRIIPADPDDNGNPARIGDIVKSLSESRSRCTSCMPAPEYLHGDGKFCEGNINIITSDCLIDYAAESASAQHSGASPINSRDITLSQFASLRNFYAVLKRFALAADSIVSSRGECAPLFRRSSFAHQVCRFTARSRFDSSGEDSPADSRSTNMQTSCDREFGFSNAIALADRNTIKRQFTKATILPSHLIPPFVKETQIVSIKQRFYAGKVYDLSTASTLYIANGILSSNCMCAWAEHAYRPGEK